jgi:ABC-type phosphate transport system auxiliary subunit
MTENRVLLLAEKINSLKIGHRAEAERKFGTLDKQIAALENDFERMVLSFNDTNFELKHLVVLS